MPLNLLITTFPWMRYSKKLSSKIEQPHSVGIFTEKESAARGMRLAIGEEGSIDDGNFVRLYWIVDPDDGVIVDSRFQVFGQSALIGAAEAACELLVGKNYDQARRISADLIDKSVRDKSDQPAFPREAYPHLNLVLEAIQNASEKCDGLPFADTYVAPPAPMMMGDAEEGGYPGWDELSLEQKKIVIEQVLDRDIRPYIALDAGGVEVLELKPNYELIIAYQGSCTSCMSSVGATLSYIQQTLRNKVSKEITVIPNL